MLHIFDQRISQNNLSLFLSVETPILKADRRPGAPLGMNEFLEEGQKRVAMGLLMQGGGENAEFLLVLKGSRD